MISSQFTSPDVFESTVATEMLDNLVISPPSSMHLFVACKLDSTSQLTAPAAAFTVLDEFGL